MMGLGAVANIADQKNILRENPITMIFTITTATASCAKTYAEMTSIAVA